MADDPTIIHPSTLHIPSLKHVDVRILIALSILQGTEKKATVSHAVIAEAAGLPNPRQVQRSTIRLEQAGLIEIHRPSKTAVRSFKVHAITRWNNKRYWARRDRLHQAEIDEELRRRRAQLNLVEIGRK